SNRAWPRAGSRPDSAPVDASAPAIAVITASATAAAILAAASGDADITHHPGVLVLDDVTMEHPVAGIVGDEGDLHPLLGVDQHGVAEIGHDLALVRLDDLEGMAVEVDRMGVRRRVDQLEDVAAAAHEGGERRRPAVGGGARPGLLVDRPEDPRRAADEI